MDHVLLFFASASHGNHGPRGHGSVVVRLQAQSHAAGAVWIDSFDLCSSWVPWLCTAVWLLICERLNTATLRRCTSLETITWSFRSFDYTDRLGIRTSLHYIVLPGY
uniref:Uncharacterized protein n=1 Tax=Peronospora matthiolae TaxID=2874970 RepID=A0AAV1VNE9_9STRA